MKKLLVAGIAAAAFCGTPALAADLPTKAPVYRAAAPAPMFNWNGCYIGAHAGGGVLYDDNWSSTHGSGGLVGGQLGCNYQTGQLVLGIEGEGFWSGVKSSDNFDTGYATVKNKSDWDIAARMGVAFDRALIYGKAGWVWGNFHYSYSDSSYPQSATANATLSGLLIGLGLEYALAPNWTAKFEYDYLGFGSKNLTETFCNSAGLCGPNTYRTGDDKHIFKFGLNYKFGDLGKAPVVAKY